MTSLPLRRPPPRPPPPRRRVPIVAKDPDVDCTDASCGTDSGISESSSVSSLPLVTSSPPGDLHLDTSDISDSGLGQADTEPLHSVSVLSLPSSSLREVKPQVLSTSLVVDKSLRRPPAPPVRTDSIRSTKKITRSSKHKVPFEEKFSFHRFEELPPPPPLPQSAEKKSYPSKVLFNCSPSPPKERVEQEPLPLTDSLKKREKKSQRLSLDPAGIWLRMGFGGSKTPSSSPRIRSKGDERYFLS